MIFGRRDISVALGALALGFAASLPLWANDGLLFVAGLVIIQALFALSWNLLFGYIGLASFGHAGFFAIGAYFTGGALRYGLPLSFPLLLLIAAALGSIAAGLIGAVVLRRLTGIFLAVLTVALTEILRILIGYSNYLGREDGLSNIPRPKIDLIVATLDLTNGRSYYWFLLIVVCAVSGGLWWLVQSRLGRVFLAVRQDAERATFIGINVAKHRLLAFVISGGVAALAGALFAPWTRIVTLDEVNWLQSTQPMLATLLGGSGSFWGPIVGAVVFSIVNYSTRTYMGFSEVIVGGVLLLIILIAPSGLVGLWRQMQAGFWKRFSSRAHLSRERLQT